MIRGRPDHFFGVSAFSQHEVPFWHSLILAGRCKATSFYKQVKNMDLTSASLCGPINLFEISTLGREYILCLGVLAISMMAIIWRNRKTEVRLSGRIQAIEEEVRTVLLPLMKVGADRFFYDDGPVHRGR
jgi:hypothetical protein